MESKNGCDYTKYNASPEPNFILPRAVHTYAGPVSDKSGSLGMSRITVTGISDDEILFFLRQILEREKG